MYLATVNAVEISPVTGITVRLSGLSVGTPAVSQAVAASFTATNVSGFLSQFDVINYLIETTGVVVDQNGTIILLMDTDPVLLGPYPPALKQNQYEAVYLTSSGTLPSYVSGQTITVYAGSTADVGNVAIGDAFANGGNLLSATAQVAAASSGGGPSPSPSPSPSGGGEGSGSTPTTPTIHGSTLSTVEKAGLVVAGVAVAGGAAYTYVASRRRQLQ